MSRGSLRKILYTPSQDDQRLYAVRRDLSGGVNTRQHALTLPDNQAAELTNIDIQTLGERTKRTGSVRIGQDVSNSDVVALHNFEVQGETDQFLMVEGTNVRKWLGTGYWSRQKTCAAVGDAQIDTAQSKFGGSSLLLDGTGDYVSVTDHAEFDFSSGVFTIDCWIRPSNLLTVGAKIMQIGNITDGILLMADTGGQVLFKVYASGSAVVNLTHVSATISINTWSHVAVVENGDSWYLFINGVVKATLTDTDRCADYSAALEIGRGDHSGGGYDYTTGWIDEFRISNSARWTADFSSSLPSSAYSADANSVLLLHFDGDDASTTITDSSSTEAIIYSSISGTDVGIVQGKESGLTPDDVVIIQDGTSNARRLDSDGNIQDLGDLNTSPPITTVGAWYANRFWWLKNDLLYYGDAYAADYSLAYDRSTEAFRIPVGTERCLAPTRDMGLIVGGVDAVWALFPSATPAATDRPEPLITDKGIVSKKGWCLRDDDFYFFSQDGFRALKRTVQDKLQQGVSYPLSYHLKDQFDDISWGSISNLSMVSYKDKILISVPTSATTYKIWCYYPAINAFTIFDGWNPLCWSKYKVSGEEYLYYGKDGNGEVYQALNGNTDEGTTTTDGTAITFTEIGKKEDFGQPFVYKNGGEVEIRAKATGNYNVSVYASFDDGSYNLLGTVNLQGGGVTFPTGFPVTFEDVNIISERFPLDPFGRFRHIQLKLVHNTTNGTDDITILETSLFAYPEEFTEE